MPGFKISDTQDNNQVKLPENIVYTYTWDISKLVQKQRNEAPSLLYLKSCSLPSYSIDTEEVNTGHANYQFAKGIKWQDIKISFYDTYGFADVLQDLSSKVWNETSGIRVADEYMDETKILIYYADWTLAYTWTLKNSWIKSVSFSELTYESSGANNVNITVAYTWAVRTPLT